MTKLELLAQSLEIKIPFYETVNAKVSSASVGWHIDHSLKVLNGVLVALKESHPEEYHWKFNKTRMIIYTFGFFPRGKVKAPKSVQCYETVTLDNLKTQFEILKSELLTVKSLDKNANFNHPIFGQLNLQQTIYFLQLHTKHHLKIINDILKK
ncbi:DUF1569 domain-containing protein [Flavobacterium sp.]